MAELNTSKTFLMKGTDSYAASEDTSVQSGKTYYTRSGSEGAYVYTEVANPTGNPSTNNYYEKSTTWTKLVNIKEYPDLGGEPNLIDVTDLSDLRHRNILGIETADSMTFLANYTKADYTTLKALEGTTFPIAVWFGGTVSGVTVTPTGSDGKFSFYGQLAVYATGGSVDAAREMNITIATTSAISFE